MKITYFYILLTLCLGIFAPTVSAQEFSAPNKAQRQGMSYEEYSQYRENMRKRMRNMTPQERNNALEHESQTVEQTENLRSEKAYGQGYNSRIRTETRSDMNMRDSKPERQQRPEKFNRGDMKHR